MRLPSRDIGGYGAAHCRNFWICWTGRLGVREAIAFVVSVAVVLGCFALLVWFGMEMVL